MNKIFILLATRIIVILAIGGLCLLSLVGILGLPLFSLLSLMPTYPATFLTRLAGVTIGFSPIMLLITEFKTKAIFKNFKRSLFICSIIPLIHFSLVSPMLLNNSVKWSIILYFIFPLLCIVYYKRQTNNIKTNNREIPHKENSESEKTDIISQITSFVSNLFPSKKEEIIIPKGFTLETTKGRYYIDNPQRGIYIQGGAGSGKSANIFEPLIHQIAELNYSGILYDFKSPELINKARNSYNHKQVDFKVIDFKNPKKGNRINPINPNYLTKSTVAVEYAQALVNNMMKESIKNEDFWSRNTKMIIAGTIWYLREKHPQFCTLPHVISLFLHTDIETLINKITEEPEAGGMVVTLKSGIERNADSQTAGVLSSIQNSLSILNNKEIFWLLSGNDFNLELNNNENPTFLAIGNDSSLPNTYSPIISLIISVALRQMNTPNKGKSIVLLDEAPTIYIPNLDQIPATARSNGISTVLGVQDFSQLIDKYGKEKAEIIISNLGNQFYGRTTNQNTATMIKNIFSKEDKIYNTSSSSSGSSGGFLEEQRSNKSKSKSESIQERDRVKVSDLINLEPGQFYGIIAEGNPREFLKTQFIQQPINSLENENNLSVTDEEIKENYYRIINEARSILK